MTEAGEDSKPPAWVGRATARPPADPWPTTEQPVYGGPAIFPAPGAPPPIVYVAQRPRRRGLTTFLIVASIFAGCCAGGATVALVTSAALRNAVGLGPSQPDAPNPGPTTHPPTSTTRPSATAAQPGLNTPVRDGKFQFVVSAVSCGHASVGEGFVTKQAQGQYCLVELSVENVGNSGQLLLDGLQKAYGPDGAVFATDSSAGVIASAGTSVWINVVKPGTTVSGTIVFDLPTGARLARLELHDSPFSRGVTVTVG